MVSLPDIQQIIYLFEMEHTHRNTYLCYIESAFKLEAALSETSILRIPKL